MTGWVPPSDGRPEPSDAIAPRPVVGWAAPADDDGPGVGDTIRAGWALTRANLEGLVAVTVVPVVAWNLLLVPVLLGTAEMVERWITFFAEIDWARYRADPDALQRDMQALYPVSPEYGAMTAIVTGLGALILIVGAAAVTSATLDAAASRKISVGPAYRAVADHATAIVLPGIILGVAVFLIGLPLTLFQTSVMSGGGGPASSAAGSLLGVLASVLVIAAIILGLRWALAIQAILAEDLGFRAGLARSVALTTGARTRIGLAVVAVSFAIAFLVTIPPFVLALLVGFASASVTAGIVTCSAVLVVSSLVSVPLLVAILTVVYEERAAGMPPVEVTAPAAG